jgi:hypothetical protein
VPEALFFSLQMIFGATHLVPALFLQYSIKLPYKVLKEEPSAKIEIPSEEQIREYQEVISSSFPVLDGTWCVVDGLKNRVLDQTLYCLDTFDLYRHQMYHIKD